VDGGGGDDVFATIVNNDDRMVADRPSLPPPPQLPPMLPPPRPCPCLRRHNCCSLRHCHCPSDAPVDGWLWCRLSPLAYCIVRRPNLSAPAIVQSSTLSLPSRRPLLLTVASHCPVALLPSINHFCLSR